MQGHCPYCNQKLSTWCKAHSVSFTQDHTITHCATFLRERAEAAEKQNKVFSHNYLEAMEHARGLEKQLAEQELAADIFSKGLDEKALTVARLEGELTAARQRIAELEGLVPDADVLDKVVEEAICWELGLPYGSDGVAYAGEMRRTATAIRKYKEATDAKD